MSQTTEKSFDCLAFKWKVESEIYREIKDLTPEQQIEYFRHHAQTGPFAELVAKLRQQESPSESK
jgi:O-phosphoseryl-tRNA(Cys) synthetase